MSTPLSLFQEILQTALIIFVVLGCGVSLAIGVGMLVCPDAVWGMNRQYSRSLPTDKLVAVLETPRKIERNIYRHHRLVGTLEVSAAVYILVALWSGKASSALQILAGSVPVPVSEWLMGSLVFVLTVCSLFAGVIGIFLVVRPSRLKGFESWMNQRYFGDSRLQRFDVMRYSLDLFVIHHRRFATAFIVFGSLYALVDLGLMLL